MRAIDKFMLNNRNLGWLIHFNVMTKVEMHRSGVVYKYVYLRFMKA